MAQPNLKNYQIQTGTDVGDIVEIIDNNGTPGLDDSIVLESNVRQHEQNIEVSLSQITQSGATNDQIIIWNNSAGEWQAVDSSAADTRTNVSDDGTQVVAGVSDINFGSNLTVTDDTDGTVTIDSIAAPEWSIVSSSTTVSHGDKIIADTSGGTFTVTLPGTPSAGQFVYFQDFDSTWSANNLTVDGNGNNIEDAVTFNANVDQGSFLVTFNGIKWIIRFGSGF